MQATDPTKTSAKSSAPQSDAELTLAVVTMTSGDDVQKNIAEAVRLVREAASQGADWVQLPEMFPYIGPYERLPLVAELEGGALHQMLAALAQDLGIVLFAGSVAERPSPAEQESRGGRRAQDKVYNTAYVFGRDGRQLAKYRKIHLFNLNGDDGRPRYCESDGFLAGEAVKTLTVDGFKVGLGICYDLRFPALFQGLAAASDPDVLVLPSAFTRGTGQAHWELLLRARAVERQAYMYAANQTGTHAPGKESFGHSMIVDPWGQVLADTGDVVGVAMARISHRMLKDVRGRLPALANRLAIAYPP